MFRCMIHPRVCNCEKDVIILLLSIIAMSIRIDLFDVTIKTKVGLGLHREMVA